MITLLFVRSLPASSLFLKRPTCFDKLIDIEVIFLAIIAKNTSKNDCFSPGTMRITCSFHLYTPYLCEYLWVLG